MEIKEMFDRVILKSGQYILRNKDIEIDVDSFRMLVEDALAIYSKAHPYEKRYEKFIQFPRQFTFTKEFDTELNRVPDWLSEVNPIRFAGVASVSNQLVKAIPSQPAPMYGEVIDPVQSPWVYHKPVLTVPYSARYEILAMFRHEIDESESVDGKKNYKVTTITIYDNVFMKLLHGMFLLGIGRSRRSFTLNDLPIVMDADQMVSDGNDLVDKATEELQNIQKIYASMG